MSLQAGRMLQHARGSCRCCGTASAGSWDLRNAQKKTVLPSAASSQDWAGEAMQSCHALYCFGHSAEENALLLKFMKLALSLRVSSLEYSYYSELALFCFGFLSRVCSLA